MSIYIAPSIRDTSPSLSSKRDESPELEPIYDSHPDHLEFEQVIDLTDRTQDVYTDQSFDELMLSDDVKEKLKRYGYIKPSPVQIEAIPLGLLGNGNFSGLISINLDLLVQAKSGTGKTLVFSVLAAETLATGEFLRYSPKVLIVAPTREICNQIATTVRQVKPDNTHLGVFIGGTDVERDKETLTKGCQVAIGTTGRLCHMVKRRELNLTKVNLFVLDEADKLMEESFHPEINYLFSSCPTDKQVCVFSATYPKNLDNLLCQYMNTPILIRLSAEDVQLLGIKQYARVISSDKECVDELLRILSNVSFSQCVVFVNDIESVPVIVKRLEEAHISVKGISSAMPQDQRNGVMKDLKLFQIRVLVSSDLTARGIDASKINLVISLGCPVQDETYLHRIGRAGRYGNYGATITILNTSRDKGLFKAMSKRQKLKVKLLPDKFPSDLPMNQRHFDNAKPFIKDPESEDSAYEQLYLNRRTESSSTLTSFGSAQPNEEKPTETPKPFKFVPSRKLKAKKQYYLRKEMIVLKDGLAPDVALQLFHKILIMRQDDPILKGILRNGDINKKPIGVNKDLEMTLSVPEEHSCHRHAIEPTPEPVEMKVIEQVPVARTIEQIAEVSLPEKTEEIEAPKSEQTTKFDPPPGFEKVEVTPPPGFERPKTQDYSHKEMMALRNAVMPDVASQLFQKTLLIERDDPFMASIVKNGGKQKNKNGKERQNNKKSKKAKQPKDEQEKPQVQYIVEYPDQRPQQPELTPEERFDHLRGTAILPAGIVGNNLEKPPCPFGPSGTHELFVDILQREWAEIEKEQSFEGAQTKGPMVHPRSTPNQYDTQLKTVRNLLAEDNYKRHMKLAEMLRNRTCLREARIMELKAEAFRLGDDFPIHGRPTSSMENREKSKSRNENSEGLKSLNRAD